jgi:hypothetical protein
MTPDLFFGTAPLRKLWISLPDLADSARNGSASASSATIDLLDGDQRNTNRDERDRDSSAHDVCKHQHSTAEHQNDGQRKN